MTVRRDSHTPIVARKPGNLSRGDPGERRGVLGREPGAGHLARALYLDPRFT